MEERYNLIDILQTQKEASLKTFGSKGRTPGLKTHIKEELKEIDEDNPDEFEEWMDVAILAFEGALMQADGDVIGVADALLRRQKRLNQIAF